MILYRLEYRGSILGWAWPLVSLVFVVAIIGTVWGVLLNKDDMSGYYLYLLASLAIWQTLSATVNKATNGFGPIADLNNLPLSSIIFEKWLGSILPLGNSLPLIIAGSIILTGKFATSITLIPVAVITLALWTLGVVMCILVIVTLHPDAKHIISSLMRLSFLATPIIWDIEKLGKYQHYIWSNPFYPPLQSVRYALTGQGQNISGKALLFSILVFIIGFLLFSRFINRIRSHSIAQCVR